MPKTIRIRNTKNVTIQADRTLPAATMLFTCDDDSYRIEMPLRDFRAFSTCVRAADEKLAAQDIAAQQPSESFIPDDGLLTVASIQVGSDQTVENAILKVSLTSGKVLHLQFPYQDVQKFVQTLQEAARMMLAHKNK